jgi:hypothetical protein
MKVSDFKKRIENEFGNIGRSSDRALLAYEKCARSNDDMYIDSAAFSILHVYSGIEKIFLNIAETIDQNVPQGLHWHHQLLLQMANPVAGIRQEVISRETMTLLDEFRAFRHVARNIYAFNLQSGKVGILIGKIKTLEALVKKDISNFLHVSNIE